MADLLKRVLSKYNIDGDIWTFSRTSLSNGKVRNSRNDADWAFYLFAKVKLCMPTAKATQKSVPNPLAVSKYLRFNNLWLLGHQILMTRKTRWTNGTDAQNIKACTGPPWGPSDQGSPKGFWNLLHSTWHRQSLIGTLNLSIFLNLSLYFLK